jgi:hypothetical protein
MVEKRIIVKAHAKERLGRGKVYNVTEEALIQLIRKPDEIVSGKGNRFVAHKVLDEDYILRVVYEEFEHEVQVITFYRAKRKRYYRGEG